MRVSYTSYSCDLESYSFRDPYAGPHVQAFENEGSVQGYVRDEGVTYAIVLSDAGFLHEVELGDLTVLRDNK